MTSEGGLCWLEHVDEVTQIFARKTKRPRLDLSLGTSVDQPSPKCCSRTTVALPPSTVNGSSVPDMALMGRYTVSH
jgi:hypothetical protein